MRYVAIFLFFCTFMTTAVAQENADYTNSLAAVKRLYNSQKNDSIYALLSDRLKGMASEEKISQSLSGLHGQLGDIVSYDAMPSKKSVGSYNTSSTKGVLLDDRTEDMAAPRNYKTTFTKGVLILTISVNAEHKLDALRFAPYTEPKTDKPESNFVLHTKGCDIFGTLTIPSGDKKCPVVLLIAGSGPTDRDGNSHLGVNSDAYKMIADSLKSAGIACLRYDKRGVGESHDTSKNELGLRFEDYVDDAVQIIKKLKADDRFSKVIIAGHSEGSLIGMIAASKEAVGGYLSISGAGERADEVLKRQFAKSTPDKVGYTTKLLDSLVAGHTVTNTDPELESIFHATVQPYLISWFKYDPQQIISKLKTKVSIIQGSADIQVEILDAELLKKSKPDAKLVIVKGMNHVLKQVGDLASREENIASYLNNKLPVCTELIRELVRIAE